MASLKFWLKRANAKEETSIFFLLNYGAVESLHFFFLNCISWDVAACIK
jgi:hypothetical protein